MKNKLVSLCWLLVVLFPTGVTWIPFFIINSNRSRPLSLSDELFLLIMQSIFVAAPFAFAAIWAKRKLKSDDPKIRKAVIISCATVFILSFSLAAWVLIDAFTRTGGGANIGAGILLMVSPFVLPAFMIVTYQILKRK